MKGIAQVESLYDGSVDEYEFHMAGTPSKLGVGDYGYTIFEHKIRGRLQITRLEGEPLIPNRASRARWSLSERRVNGSTNQSRAKVIRVRATTTGRTGPARRAAR